jgi:carbon-monoxide dehydrogenase medium subunit
MSPIEYHRPDSLEQAIRLLPDATPLAGGTALTPRRAEVRKVIDLQQLPLDELTVESGSIRLGATCKLQAIVEYPPPLPRALAQAAAREAPLNLRNMATVAGALVACDGRSPLATVLLAMNAVAQLLPGDSLEALDRLLESRPHSLQGKLITRIQTKAPLALAYEQVARSPRDLPIVCAALGLFETTDRDREFHLSLGGSGSRPVCVPLAGVALAKGDLDAAASAASAAYARADDEWASAEYRAHVAGVLTRRLAREVTG